MCVVILVCVHISENLSNNVIYISCVSLSEPTRTVVPIVLVPPPKKTWVTRGSGLLVKQTVKEINIQCFEYSRELCIPPNEVLSDLFIVMTLKN